MAKMKKMKIPTRRSTMAMYRILLLALLAFILLSFVEIVFSSDEDMKIIEDFFAWQEDVVLILMFLIDIVVVCCMLVWFLLKYFLLFLPSFFALILLIPALVLLKASAEGGRFCYKYRRNRSVGKTASIFCLIYAGVGLLGLFVSKWISNPDNISSGGEAVATISVYYEIGAYALSALSALFGVITLISVKKGITDAANNGEQSEEEEKRIALEERNRMIAQGGGFTVGGYAQSIQTGCTFPISQPQNDDTQKPEDK